MRDIENFRLVDWAKIDNLPLDTVDELNLKQDALVSWTNIKTINGSSILWDGDIIVTSEATVADGSITEAKLSPSVNTSLNLADSSVQPSGLTNYFNKSVDDTDDITIGITNKFVTAGEKTKLGHINVTQSVDLDAIETNSNASKVKTDFITITQAVNLDTLESDTATNNAKISNATHTGEVTGATALTITNDAVTNAKLSNMANATIKGRATAGTGDPEDLTASQVKTLLAITNTDVSWLGTLATQNGTFSWTHSGNSSGTNTGDQTSIAGIIGTKEQFNTAVTDWDIMYIGDAPTSHTHPLSQISDVTMTVANLNSLDDWVNSALHFHNTDRDRTNHTWTQTVSTISNFNESVEDIIGTKIIAGANTTVTYNDTTGETTIASTWWWGGWSGDVVWPASSTDNAIARFDTTTWKLIQNSVVTISDTWDVSWANIVSGTVLGTTYVEITDDNFTLVDNVDNTKGLNFQLSSISTGTTATKTIQGGNWVIVERDTTDTLTNKTLTSPVINTPTGIVKWDVGLWNVDNTSDVNKPVSTATQTSLNLKANLTGATFSGDISVPDEIYWAGWNGSLEVPTKNAIYDKIETIWGWGWLTIWQSYYIAKWVF